MTNTKFYELEDDVERPGRWHLDELTDEAGVQFDPCDFTRGVRVKTKPRLRLSLFNEYKTIDVTGCLSIAIQNPGTPLGFTFAGFEMPVVKAAVGALLEAVAGKDIQRIPVRVAGARGKYEIINAVSHVDCIDTERSEIEWFEEGNDVRPDLAGEPESINTLVIDPRRCSGRHIFRPTGWDVALIVSSSVKDALTKARVSGVKFLPV